MLAALLSNYQVVTLFACAGLALYLAGRAAVDALTSLADPSPGLMALGHWMPIAWSAVLATLAGHFEIGIGLLLATSVASLALVLGVLLCVASEGMTGKMPHARAWPLVLPASVLVFLAGFSGSLNWIHMLMLPGLGGCILGVWLGREQADEAIPFAMRQRGSRARAAGSGFDLTIFPAAGAVQLDPPPADPLNATAAAGNASSTEAPPASLRARDIPSSSPPSPKNRYWRAQLLLALALGAAGGWMGYKGIILANQRTHFASTGLITLAVLSPLLMLSLLGTGAAVAHNRRFGSVIAAIVAIVLLNLCLLLPLVVLCNYLREFIAAWYAGAHTLAAIGPALEPMPFPISAWRVDTVLLIVIALMLVPVSLGRLKLGRFEGMGLAIIYAAYLIAATAVAIRL